MLMQGHLSKASNLDPTDIGLDWRFLSLSNHDTQNESKRVHVKPLEVARVSSQVCWT